MSKIRPARAAFERWFREAGLSQAEVGDAIGASQQTVSKLLVDFEPGEALARRIEEATRIPWLDWYSSAKRRRLEARLAAARALRPASP